MNPIRKAFLFVVGVMSIAYEETAKSLEEAAQIIEEQRRVILGNDKHVETIPKIDA